jgi:hypothetical protein
METMTVLEALAILEAAALPTFAAPSMVHLPKPLGQFKNFVWDFPVVSVVVFPR